MRVRSARQGEMDDIERLAHSDLKERWNALFKISAPKAASRIFLLRALSYELQSQHVAGLSKADQKLLKRLQTMKGADDTKALAYLTRAQGPKISVRQTLVPGSRLMRVWNSQTYTVSVIEEGFVYKDRVWTSLSAIAKDITGAHWSGPRFFGLHKAATL